MVTQSNDETFGYPLSFAQRRLWFLDQLFPAVPLHNLPLVLHLSVPINAQLIERCLREMARRHEALRTTFRTVDGEPVQVVVPSADVPLRVVVLDHLEQSEREAAALAFAADDLRRPFDLTVGPLWRATLVRLADADHFLILTAHHIVSDGWSMGLMLQELQSLYTAFAAGERSPLPELPLQYVDYAIWQHEALSSDVLARQLAYWREALDDLPTIELPADRPRPAVATLRGHRHYFALSAEGSRAVDDLAQQEGATPFMVLLAAYALLLHQCTGEVDIPIGTPIAGRSRAEFEPIIGFFVNTLVLRADISANPTFGELVRRIRERALAAYTHQDLPFEKLVEDLQPARDLSRNPLFQVMFALQNAPTAGAKHQATTSRSVEIETGLTSVDLAMDVWKRGDLYAARIEYNLDLFDDRTIQQLAQRYTVLLDAITRAPQKRLSDYRSELTTREEASAALPTAAPHATVDETTVVALIDANLSRNADAIAVVWPDGSLTAAEVDRRTRALAGVLRVRGVGPEQPVAVVLDPSPDALIAMLATWRAGGVYVPLDPRDPPMRLRAILEDVDPTVVLTTRLHGALVTDIVVASSNDATRPNVVFISDAVHDSGGDLEGPKVEPHDLAYIVYTSGSTGTPRGVAVEHRSLANHARWMQSSFPLAPGDRVLQTTSLGFDVSLWELVVPMTTGATLVVPTVGAEAEPVRVVAQLARDYVTAFQTTPSFLRLMLDEPAFRACGSLRWVFCGAESMPRDLAARFQDLETGAILYNMYGPTESTIDAAFYACPHRGMLPDTRSGAVPIGSAIAGVRLYVLDAAGELVAPGAPGELHIGGASLAREYWRRPEVTAQRFVPDPFAGAGQTMYRTGDRVRALPGGSLELLGRIDRQIKLRGVRIEPEEIERVLSTHADVHEAFVAPGVTAGGESRLVAYVGINGSALSAAELRRFLDPRLPRSMIPGAFVLLDVLPRTARDKIDRRALARFEPATIDGAQSYLAPRSELESQVVAIWEKLLAVSRIGVQDNFFDLGGHSLLATQVISRVLGRFEVAVSLRAFFEEPTVAGLALLIASAQLERSVAAEDLGIDLHDMHLAPEGVDRFSDHEVTQLLRAMLEREARG